MRNIYTGLFLLLFYCANSQSTLQAANDAYEKRKYNTAVELYQKILNKPDKKTDVADVEFQVANCYRNMARYDEALSWYIKAKTDGYSNPVYSFYEGSVYLKKGDYSKAQEKLLFYLALKPNDADATRLLNNCKYAISSLPDTTVTIQNEKSLNTIYSEYAAVSVKDKVIFTSSRIEEKGEPIYPLDGQGFSHIYQAAYFKEDKLWSKATRIRALNTPYNDGVVSYCSKTQMLYFTHCNDGKSKNDFCRIMQSVFDVSNNTWGTPKPISLAFAQKGNMEQPSISSDGETLFFSSKMEGSFGGSDIWMMKKSGEQWSEPVNLGKNVNTELDELFPVIVDSALYFSSEGNLGYGGLDLFVSVFKNGEWSKAENMNAPFNSSGDDFAISFNPDHTSGYFSSNRSGGVGADDIYSFYPTPVVLMLKGRITDTENNQVPIGTKIILSTDGRSDTVYITKTYEYFFYLDKDKDYKVSVYRPGYFGDSKRFSTKGIKKSMEFSANTGFNFDFPIRRIPKEEISIENIYYDFGSVNFKEESKPSLDKLAKLLEDTPDAIVQINSHTDEKGAYEINMKVSEARAKAVADYLISKGIDKERVKYKGWGYTQPVVKGAITEEDNQKNSFSGAET